jgi:hypothetical protein
VTEPVGVPDDEETVAVNDSDCPNVEGLSDEVSAVDVAAAVTVARVSVVAAVATAGDAGRSWAKICADELHQSTRPSAATQPREDTLRRTSLPGMSHLHHVFSRRPLSSVWPTIGHNRLVEFTVRADESFSIYVLGMAHGRYPRR